MKKHVIRPIALLAAGLLWAGMTHAQESANAAGGDATGTGGSVAYSVGQVVYTTQTGTTGSLAQGVQQPFEISVVTGLSETSIQLEMSAYPNPTTDFLTLKVNAFEGLNLQLTDLRGNVISSKNIAEFNTIISMEGLAKSIYFLRISNENHVVKTFKITKI
jgi:Secretion system C-terminal sorting domain